MVANIQMPLANLTIIIVKTDTNTPIITHNRNNIKYNIIDINYVNNANTNTKNNNNTNTITIANNNNTNTNNDDDTHINIDTNTNCDISTNTDKNYGIANVVVEGVVDVVNTATTNNNNTHVDNLS